MWLVLQSVQTEMAGPSALELAYTDNLFNMPDAAAAIRDYASKGYDIVIAHRSQYGSSAQDIAPDFPDTTFAWGTDVNTFGLKNVYAYTARRRWVDCIGDHDFRRVESSKGRVWCVLVLSSTVARAGPSPVSLASHPKSCRWHRSR